MGTSDVLKVLKVPRAVGECNLKTFKTSLMPINHEMHEQVHTIFYLLYSQQKYSNVLLCSCSYSSSFGFSFLSVTHVCQTFNQVCVALNVFLLFAFSLSSSTMFWFDKANRLSAIFFRFGVQIWRFPDVSIATSILHSITWIAHYNLFMHSPFANQKQDVSLVYNKLMHLSL